MICGRKQIHWKVECAVNGNGECHGEYPHKLRICTLFHSEETSHSFLTYGHCQHVNTPIILTSSVRMATLVCQSLLDGLPWNLAQTFMISRWWSPLTSVILIFPLAPPWGWHVWFSLKCLDNYQTDWRQQHGLIKLIKKEDEEDKNRHWLSGGFTIKGQNSQMMFDKHHTATNISLNTHIQLPFQIKIDQPNEATLTKGHIFKLNMIPQTPLVRFWQNRKVWHTWHCRDALKKQKLLGSVKKVRCFLGKTLFVPNTEILMIKTK